MNCSTLVYINDLPTPPKENTLITYFEQVVAHAVGSMDNHKQKDKKQIITKFNYCLSMLRSIYRQRIFMIITAILNLQLCREQVVALYNSEKKAGYYFKL